MRALHAGYLAALTAALGTGPLETGATPFQPGATPFQPGATDRRSDAASELWALAAVLGLPAGAHDPDVPGQRAHRFTLAPGDAVAFTGQTREPREALEERAQAAGLRVAPRVTRDVTLDVTLVVAADVDTMSIKARAARDYGVPVVGPGRL